jgi:predicted PolB exonuclease-like 3'-5' exonuclease
MLVFDLETAADHTAVEFLPEPEAPSNYKSPEAIDKYKAEARQKDIARMALGPATCRIVAIGTCLDGTVKVSVCPDTDVERKAIAQFWDMFSNTRNYTHDGSSDDLDFTRSDVVGYNCVGFDLPVLLTRSRILGVPHPKLMLRKYGSPDCRDLMLELSFGGMVDYKSLNFWCKRLRLDVPPDDTSGKDMAEFVAAGDWHAVAHHCSVDVLKTYELAKFINLL